MLVGNKLDMETSRKTPKELGERFAEEEGLLFTEASAKTGDGVEDLFMEIGESTFDDCLVIAYDGDWYSPETTSCPSTAADTIDRE